MTTSIHTTRLNDVNLEAVGALVQAVQNDETAGHTTWEAKVDWKGGFRSEASIHTHQPIKSDEPAALGGTATGPNPVEQLLGALGNCLAVGYAANATIAGLEIESLSIDVSGDLDLHTFLGLKPGHAGFSGIKADVHIKTNGDAAAEAELHNNVVSTSPVGHTLGAVVPVDVSLV